jgi:hypothetical protein
MLISYEAKVHKKPVGKNPTHKKIPGVTRDFNLIYWNYLPNQSAVSFAVKSSYWL